MLCGEAGAGGLLAAPVERQLGPVSGFPGCCCAGGVSFAMVSDWASFAGDLAPVPGRVASSRGSPRVAEVAPQVPGCELALHLPVKNPAAILWDEMAGAGVRCPRRAPKNRRDARRTNDPRGARLSSTPAHATATGATSYWFRG